LLQSGGTMPDELSMAIKNKMILEYLELYSATSMVVFDKQMVIKDCNQAFLHLLGMSAEPVGNNLKNYLPDEERELLSKHDQSGFHQVRFTLINSMHSQYSMVGYLAPIDDGFLLLCEKTWITDDDILKEISIINNQLANMDRELNKKNIALEKANATINKLLRSDVLTGIANRRHFIEYFEKMYAYAVRHGNPLALVMADIDFFKQTNDQYGHQAGDDVLIEFARLLQENCREEDLAARYGGEEFAVLLVQADLEQALSQAERIRAGFEMVEVGEAKVKSTASFGVAALGKAETLEEIIKRADDALYKAKNAGRNRVEVAQ
jgi:two-component system, cell cycle response regulator